MVGYACYADRFAGTLAGVGEHAGYLEELGVHYLHLMPCSGPATGTTTGVCRCGLPGDPTRPGDRRGPQSPRHDAAPSRISLVLDLVLNHVAREHEWAVKARAGDPAYQKYFYLYPDRSLPDQYEQTLPDVFPDFAPGQLHLGRGPQRVGMDDLQRVAVGRQLGQPGVLLEYVDVIFFLANLGWRCSASTPSPSSGSGSARPARTRPRSTRSPRCSARRHRLACPAVAFKAEPSSAPATWRSTSAKGTRRPGQRPAYHNSLMVQLWSMIATGDVHLSASALGALPAIPTTATWVTYVRCHDDIGWAIDDGDAAAVGLNGALHRAFLADWYSGTYAGSPAAGLVFQHNEQTGDRRISGTSASLCSLATATTAEDEGHLAPARMFLVHAVVGGWGGVPVIWSGDELGLPNDPVWASEPGHEDDNRWAHRPRLDWALAAHRTDLTTTTGRSSRASPT